MKLSPLRIVTVIAAYVAPPVVLVLVGLFVTQNSTNYLFPPLTDVAVSLGENWFSSAGLEQILPSLRNLIAGYLIAVVLGIVVGAMLGTWSAFRQLMLPMVDFMRSLPAPVLLPLGVLLLGIGAEMKIAVIAFGCIWPMLYGAMEGIRSVEPVRSNMSQVFRLRWRDRWRHVLLPGAGPHIVAGMHSGLQIAFVLIIISEIIASTSGIGFSILQSSRNFRYADTWAGTVLLGLLGLLLNFGFGLFESVALRWRTNETRARRSA